MKLFPALFLLVLCAFTSCGKKEKAIEPVVEANAGGYKFYTSGKRVSTEKSVSGTTPSMYIEATMPKGGAMIKIWIRNYTGALDTLQMDSTDATGSFVPETPSIEKIAAHGQLIVTEATPSFKGTFDFICTDATHVTGNFKVAP
jgi:hypothetical protein